MNYISNNIWYRPCIKCKIAYTNLDESYCSNCKYKPSSKKPISTAKYKVYMTKFDSKKNINAKNCLSKFSGSELGMLISFIVIYI
jgi:hypothetical protein